MYHNHPKRINIALFVIIHVFRGCWAAVVAICVSATLQGLRRHGITRLCCPGSCRILSFRRLGQRGQSQRYEGLGFDFRFGVGGCFGILGQSGPGVSK